MDPTNYARTDHARGSSRRRALWALLALALPGCVPGPEEPVHGVGERRSLLEMALDPADLRPEARRLLLLAAAGPALPEPDPRPLMAFTSPPSTIRVWRRSQGGTNSCAGPITTLSMEDYVKGVLPYEWYQSWVRDSHRSGAVAIRTYASYWVVAGGKYTCADLCDTTYSQVYKDTRVASVSVAVDDTRSQVLLKNSSLVFAEYSAENGDPTKTGVSDSVCAGKTLYGHGRGLCQWGSQRWASTQSKDYKWIVLHYYPGSSLWTPTGPSPDQSVPKPDRALPRPDQKVLPVDRGRADQRVLPADGRPRTDGPQRKDGAVPRRDGARADRGKTPFPDGPGPGPAPTSARVLQGGCSLAPACEPRAPAFLLLLLWALRRRRRC